MSRTVHFGTLRSAREHFKDFLDAAANGVPTSVTRDRVRVAGVDAERLIGLLAKARPAEAVLVPEDNGWSIFLPGLPIAADGANLDEALDEMVEALRDYAQAWSERLRAASNHEQNWALVQLIDLSSDDQLKTWLRGEG